VQTIELAVPLRRGAVSRRRPSTATTRAAVAATVLATASTLAALVMELRLLAPEDRELWLGPLLATGLVAAPVGGLIVRRLPRHPLGWSLVAVGASSGLYGLANAGTVLALHEGLEQVWVPWAAWALNFLWLPTAWLFVVVIPQVFPTGRPLPGRVWAALWWSSLALAGAVLLLLTVLPVSAVGSQANPLLGNWWGADAEHVVAAVMPAVMVGWSVGMALVGLTAIIARLIRADHVERRQTGLVLLTCAVVVVALSTAAQWVLMLAVLLCLVSIVASTAAFHLFGDVLVVSRAAVGVMLVVLLGSVYLATVSGLGWLIGTTGAEVTGGADDALAAAVGTAAVVGLFEPARRRARRWLGQSFSRGLPDPHHIVTALQAAAASAQRPAVALTEATSVLGAVLGRPGLRVETGVAPPAGPADHPVLLQWQGTSVGWLTGTGGKRFSVAERAVLNAVTPTLGLLAHDVQVTSDLEASRRAVVAAREEERRRLRRDLHDGLGPLLAGAALSLGVARQATGNDSARVRELLDDAAGDLRTAVTDIRDIVQGLRPAALDDLGLVAAIEQLVPGRGLPVVVRVSGDLGQLSAITEVTAYRIVAEALTNVVRHARATKADVTLTVGGHVLELAVQDDGVGITDGVAPGGIGLRSMRERVAELGGTWRMESDRGTRITALLPLGGPDHG